MINSILYNYLNIVTFLPSSPYLCCVEEKKIPKQRRNILEKLKKLIVIEIIPQSRRPVLIRGPDITQLLKKFWDILSVYFYVYKPVVLLVCKEMFYLKPS